VKKERKESNLYTFFFLPESEENKHFPVVTQVYRLKRSVYKNEDLDYYGLRN